jgi:hypothetical protein
MKLFTYFTRLNLEFGNSERQVFLSVIARTLSRRLCSKKVSIPYIKTKPPLYQGIEMALRPTPEQWIQSLRGPVTDDGRFCRRLPYPSHKDKIEALDWVSQGLSQLSEEMPRGGLSAMAKRTGIPDSTLDTWKRKLSLNARWRPSRKAYGRPKRIFNDFEEFLRGARIKTNFLEKGLYYCDKDLKFDAGKFSQERVVEREQGILLGGPVPAHPNPEAFLCSQPFI